MVRARQVPYIYPSQVRAPHIRWTRFCIKFSLFRRYYPNSTVSLSDGNERQERMLLNLCMNCLLKRRESIMSYVQPLSSLA